ncbi:MAG: hypothetical protein WCR24_03605 [Candidatus Methanomethylophilaceae archaeon]
MTESIRYDLGIDGHMLDLDQIYPEPKLKDLTEEVNQRLMLPIPKGSQVTKSSMCIVGGQGSGKTELEKTLYGIAVSKYGLSNINLIYTDDVRVALDMLNDRPVQFIVIDDAMTNASSREVYKQTEILKIYNRSRHKYEEELQGKPGHIIYIWAWQRFGELDPSFRQSEITMFKTGIAEPSERRLIQEFIGPYYTKYLWSLWDKMNRGNNQVKSTSVACINSIFTGGTGKYVSAKIDIDFPDMIRGEDYFGAEENTDILDQYREKPGWEKRIRCYELYQEGNHTQKEIADTLGLSRQGYVSESVRKVKELLRSK